MAANWQMTMDELIKNPTGPSSSYFTRRDSVRRNLNERFKWILSENNNRFSFRIFRLRSDNYFFKFEVPSEKFVDLNYDVVLKFIETDEGSEKRTITDYYVQLWSNSPDFMFTYTYVLNDHNMLVPMMKSKSSDRALRERPKEKNPVESYGFEKSCYYGLRYIKRFKLYRKSHLNDNLANFRKGEFLDSVDHQVEKLEQYKKMKKDGAEQYKRKPKASF